MLAATTCGQRPEWRPERPPLRPLQILIRWAAAALALLVASWIVPAGLLPAATHDHA